MKKAILFTLFSLLFVQYGCESHHRDADIQEQQERNEAAGEDVRPQPVSEHEGGNSGSK